jgi:glycosyltransferase involved in cell wall biosynthesis
MKIAHLNTHSYGGAAVVARRLHRAALAAGVESKLITKYGLRRDATPNYVPLRSARALYFLRRQSAEARLYRVGKTVQRLMQHPNLANRPEGLEVFSPLNTRRQYRDCIDEFEPDVIHLHWIAGFVDHEDFFRHNQTKKFVWTLHDMNPFTGGCHHADGCVRFATDCRACPQLLGTIDPDYASQVLTSKARSLAQLRDDQLVFVAPSRWLLELCAQSRVAGRFRRVLIDNPSFETSESNGERKELRASLGLPVDRKIALFVSDNLRNPRKGVAVLFAAARMLPRRAEVDFVGLGQRTDVPAGLSVIFAGRPADEVTLSRYYACADVLINPSVTENASLVIIEALSSGTPVVAFASGGTPELVNAGCGALARPGDVGSLAEAMDDVLFRRSFRATDIKASAAKHEPREHSRHTGFAGKPGRSAGECRGAHRGTRAGRLHLDHQY